MKKMLKNKDFAQKWATILSVTVAFVVLYFMSNAGILSRSLRGELVRICVYICLTVSLNLLVGVCGELSLGHASFMGVGIYAGVIAASLLKNILPDPTVRLIACLLCGGLSAGVVGFLVGIPALRLRGDYLAIVTLGFGEILRNILQNLYVGSENGTVKVALASPDAKLPEWDTFFIKGSVGTNITADNKLATFTMGFLLVLFTLFVVFNIINSKEGRAIKAVRDNRIAAESVGINVTAFRMKAFVISAVLAGMAGALYGLDQFKISPTEMGYNKSIDILVYVVLGGLGNVLGSVVSATVLYLLPMIMQTFAVNGSGAMAGVAGFFEEYRMILYAIILIVLMICTWSPKVKGRISVFTAGVKAKLFRKKGEVEQDA